MFKRPLTIPQIEVDGKRSTQADEEAISLTSTPRGLVFRSVPIWTDKSGHAQELATKVETVLVTELPKPMATALLELFDSAREEKRAAVAERDSIQARMLSVEDEIASGDLTEKQKKKKELDLQQARLDLRKAQNEVDALTV